MKHYAIFYQTSPHGKPNTNKPYAAIHINNKNITIHGTQKFINDWTHYFQNSPGWKKHQQQPNPLQHLTQNTTNTNIHTPNITTAQTDYQNALKNLPPQTKTKTITTS